ncbi:hypothetical protein ACLUXI_07925 [Bifidobacterium apri]
MGDNIPDIDFGIMPGASIVQNDSAKSRILHIEYRIDDFPYRRHREEEP